MHSQLDCDKMCMSEGRPAWSIAQGMRHQISFLFPKIWGKVGDKAGAACTAGNAIFPDEEGEVIIITQG